MSTDTTLLKDAGVLSNEEQQVLIASQERVIRFYLISIIVCAVFFWTIVGLLGGIAIFIARKKQLSLLAQMHQDAIPVSRVTGILTKRKGAAQLFIISVGSYVLPMVITYSQYKKSDMRRYVNQTVTAEVLPTLGMNRCYYDSRGNGYNFITRSKLTD